MKTKLGRYDVVVAVLDLKIEILFGEILCYCVKSVRLVQIIPSTFVLFDALAAEIC